MRTERNAWVRNEEVDFEEVEGDYLSLREEEDVWQEDHKIELKDPTSESTEKSLLALSSR